MRMLLPCLTALLAVTGCMSDVRTTSTRHTYDCSGLGKGWGDCTQQADAQCGANQYTVVSRSGEAEKRDSGGNTEMQRTMVVSCKQ